LKSGRPTIALVEDEPLVRTALAAAMDQASFNVISAASGVEGLTLLDDPRIDVAVIDIRLPGRLDGIAIAREARRRNPALRIIFTSGQPPDEDVSELGEFLIKPTRVASLLEAVTRQLDLARKLGRG
jgi:DNA-binding response OmpR family regulator